MNQIELLDLGFELLFVAHFLMGLKPMELLMNFDEQLQVNYQPKITCHCHCRCHCHCYSIEIRLCVYYYYFIAIAAIAFARAITNAIALSIGIKALSFELGGKTNSGI